MPRARSGRDVYRASGLVLGSKRAGRGSPAVGCRERPLRGETCHSASRRERRRRRICGQLARRALIGSFARIVWDSPDPTPPRARSRSSDYPPHATHPWLVSRELNKPAEKQNSYRAMTPEELSVLKDLIDAVGQAQAVNQANHYVLFEGCLRHSQDETRSVEIYAKYV